MSTSALLYNQLMQNNFNLKEEDEQQQQVNESTNSITDSSESEIIENHNQDNNKKDYNADEEEEDGLEENICEDEEAASNEEDDLEDDGEDYKYNQKNLAKIMPNLNQLYQQNCVAAAQMMQLMCSTASSSSSSTTSEINHGDNSSPRNQPGSENEKENIPICKYCNKVFANFSNLNHHISAIHLNQSKWVCSQCGKICSSKSNLKVHLRVHLRVKPYHCRWCSYSCMHHSSIRDHLAKVHPDQTHTPLQPGYLFNSQAVPEPEVFNSNYGHNTSSSNDSNKMKRERVAEIQQPNDNRMASPEKTRPIKKSKQLKQEQQQMMTPTNTNNNNNQDKRFSLPPNYQQAIQSPHQNQLQTQNIMSNQFQPQLGQQKQQSQSNQQSNSPMSNLYNAFTMARMFPFMYNPIQFQQYASATQNINNTNTSQTASQSAFLQLLNQNLLQLNSQQSHQSRFSNFNHLPSNSNNNSNNNFLPSASSSSDEHQTSNSSNLSYSTSSRSSSLSPQVSNNNKPSTKMHNISTSMDDHNQQPQDLSLNFKTEKQSEQVHSSSYTTVIPSTKKTLTVESMLNNSNITKINQETQTESSCLNCPYCSRKAI